MANYNTQLQSNNTDLQIVLQTLQTKAAGGGDTSEVDGLIMGTISSCTNDRVTSIRTSAFYNCKNLTTVNFPAVTDIGNNAFYGCGKLASVSFPVATSIGLDAFHYCYSLTTVSFPAAKYINYYAFYYCGNLTSISFPAATSIGTAAFYYCSSLTTANFPAVTTISTLAFYGCYSLTAAIFPVATTIGSLAFIGCKNLTTISFPNASYIGSLAFNTCESLTTANFPAATTIYSSAFNYCKNLTTASFPAATTISYAAFSSCYNLKSLYLTGSSVCNLYNSYAFTSTPIGGYSGSAGTYGKIYVPASLLTSYKTATNWTYFSSRFVGVDENGNALITFMIDDKEYQALSGMTWGEWVNSSYNTDSVYIGNPSKVMIGAHPIHINFLLLLADDIIRPSALYKRDYGGSN